MQNLANLSQAELIALVGRMQADAAARDASKITLKVGEKGTVCLYHGSRYPIALYAEQWERLLPFLQSGVLEKFIAANSATLSRKPRD